MRGQDTGLWHSQRRQLGKARFGKTGGEKVCLLNITSKLWEPMKIFHQNMADLPPNSNQLSWAMHRSKVTLFYWIVHFSPKNWFKTKSCVSVRLLCWNDSSWYSAIFMENSPTSLPRSFSPSPLLYFFVWSGYWIEESSFIFLKKRRERTYYLHTLDIEIEMEAGGFLGLCHFSTKSCFFIILNLHQGPCVF